ncbi:MAG TPA: hypothetical protein VJ622_04755 [Acidimicrobiia bacterium]|nr:hypothetical protein [Acidimicrobiia bacterium]
MITNVLGPCRMASQALTAQVACGGRLTLGIGPSHHRHTGLLLR